MTGTDSYLRPETLDEAVRALGYGQGHRIAAGCTDLFPATERKVLAGPILDITGIPELRGIRRDPSGLAIGAATTWAEIARADLPRACRGLQQAAREVGAKQIQNRGTIGGNLCNASPAADGVPPLMTLDAEVEVVGPGGARRLPLDGFLAGPRQTSLLQGEVLTSVHIPAAALAGQGAFVKLGARRYLVISIAMVAARLIVTSGTITHAAISVGACSAVARRLGTVEVALVGQRASDPRIEKVVVAAALDPIDDMRADRHYRADAATDLVARAVRQAGEGTA